MKPLFALLHSINLASDIPSHWGNPFSRDSAPGSATTLCFLNFTFSDNMSKFLPTKEPVFKTPATKVCRNGSLTMKFLKLNALLWLMTAWALSIVRKRRFEYFYLSPLASSLQPHRLNHVGLIEELRYLRKFSFELPSNISFETIIRKYRGKCIH